MIIKTENLDEMRVHIVNRWGTVIPAMDEFKEWNYLFYKRIDALTKKIFATIPFTTRLYFFINNWNVPEDVPGCLECGASLYPSYQSRYVPNKDKRIIYCSRKCLANSDITKTKMKATNIEKYGVETALNLESSRERYKSISLEKYGVEHPMKSKDFLANSGVKSFAETLSDEKREEIKKANLEKYGVEHYTQTEECKAKKRATNLKRYGVAHYTQSDRYKTEHKNRKFKSVTNETFTSTEENSLYNFIKSISTNDVIQRNRSLLKGSELDIVSVKDGLAIELNGVYWHSEAKGKDKDYHLNKLIECEKLGIKLYQFWDYEYNNKRDLVHSMIRSHLKLNTRIYARKCNIVEVSNVDAAKFFEVNHIQGYSKAGNINIGLMYDNAIVAMIAMGKSRFNKQYDYELIRFCNKLNTNVVGGFSKLLKSFRLKCIGSIITYANRRWSNGNLYIKSGFEFLGSTKPSYFYTYNGKVDFSRYEAQKHKLKNFLANFDETLSEVENMHKHKYFRVFDCGNLVFVLN